MSVRVCLKNHSHNLHAPPVSYTHLQVRRKEGLKLKKNLPGYFLMAPAVIAVLALSVYPLFRGIYLSFLNYNLVRPNDPAFNTLAGLQNYINIFKDKVFLQSIGNTVK